MYLWIYDLMTFVLAHTDSGAGGAYLNSDLPDAVDYVEVRTRPSSQTPTVWVDAVWLLDGGHIKASTTTYRFAHRPLKARSVPKPGECIHTPAVLAMAGARLGRFGVCASRERGGLGDWYLYFARGGRV